MSHEEEPLPLAALDGGTIARVGRWALRVLLLAALAAGGLYAFKRLRTSSAPPAPESTRVQRATLVQSTQATGRVVPREELFVRPLVSGILVELRVHAGDRVRRGDHLATVRIVADPVTLSDAQGAVRTAQVRLSRAQRERARLEAMGARQLASAVEIAGARDDERLAREELLNAQSRAELVARGTSQSGGATRSTRVLAPIDATVLAVPVTVGDYVSETSAFRDGTTLVTLANMNDLLFKGQIEEAYVGQLRLAMPVRIRVGALPGRTLEGTLRWVSPRASVESAVATVPAGNMVPVLTASTVGVTRFELWASIAGDTEGVRAGYSASAEIELARREGALAVNEAALRFEGDRAFARRCAATPGGPPGAEVALRVGLSDGVKIELLEGAREGDCLLVRTP